MEERINKQKGKKKEKLLCERHCQYNEKASHRLGENICKGAIDKQPLSKRHKELLKLYENINLIRKWKEDMKRKLTKEEIQKGK